MTKLQYYLLNNSQDSVETVAKKFHTSCRDVMETYHRLVEDGTVARYETMHHSGVGPGRISDEEAIGFDRFIKWLMKEHCLGWKELSEYINEPCGTVYNWVFSGRRPRPKTVIRIANRLGIDVDDIVCFKGA